MTIYVGIFTIFHTLFTGDLIMSNDEITTTLPRCVMCKFDKEQSQKLNFASYECRCRYDIEKAAGRDKPSDPLQICAGHRVMGMIKCPICKKPFKWIEENIVITLLYKNAPSIRPSVPRGKKKR